MSTIALDTNLLLLLIIGTATGDVVGKRLKQFTQSDLQILNDCLAGVDRVVVTPNVWTEVSNIWQFGIEGKHWANVSSVLVAMINSSVEVVKPSKEVINDPDFLRLGLADCVWLAVLDQNTTLLTVDLALCDVALSRGLKAVNFNHLRDFG